MILNASIPDDNFSEVNAENAAPQKEGDPGMEPGVFDYQSAAIWEECEHGVSFPTRSNPGYKEAIRFSEDLLLDTNLSITVKKEFDAKLQSSGYFLHPYSKSTLFALSRE